MGSPALLVRFHEPEPLVHAPGDLGEDIGAVRVLELVHLFDADPSRAAECGERVRQRGHVLRTRCKRERIIEEGGPVRDDPHGTDRKSTRLNSSHSQISYAVFCLTKKKVISYEFSQRVVV